MIIDKNLDPLSVCFPKTNIRKWHNNSLLYILSTLLISIIIIDFNIFPIFHLCIPVLILSSLSTRRIWSGFPLSLANISAIFNMRYHSGKTDSFVCFSIQTHRCQGHSRITVVVHHRNLQAASASVVRVLRPISRSDGWGIGRVERGSVCGRFQLSWFDYKLHRSPPHRNRRQSQFQHLCYCSHAHHTCRRTGYVGFNYSQFGSRAIRWRQNDWHWNRRPHVCRSKATFRKCQS